MGLYALIGKIILPIFALAILAIPTIATIIFCIKKLKKNFSKKYIIIGPLFGISMTITMCLVLLICSYLLFIPIDGGGFGFIFIFIWVIYYLIASIIINIITSIIIYVVYYNKNIKLSENKNS